MTKAEKLILKKLKLGQYVLTVHARERMSERFISDLDIIEVSRTLKTIRHQKANDTYLLSGLSTWEERVGIVVAVRDHVVIVTLFYEEDL